MKCEYVKVISSRTNLLRQFHFNQTEFKKISAPDLLKVADCSLIFILNLWQKFLEITTKNPAIFASCKNLQVEWSFCKSWRNFHGNLAKFRKILVADPLKVAVHNRKSETFCKLQVSSSRVILLQTNFMVLYQNLGTVW